MLVKEDRMSQWSKTDYSSDADTASEMEGMCN